MTDLASQPDKTASLAPTFWGGRSGACICRYAPKLWQVTVGYQFNHIRDSRLHSRRSGTFGVNGSVVHYFGKMVGVEGNAGAGFGSLVAGTSLNSLFFGAGPHLVFRNHSHYEPWIHALGGAEHINFGVPSPVKPTSAAWLLGGGFDYNFTSGFGVRIQADYLGSFFRRCLPAKFPDCQRRGSGTSKQLAHLSTK